MGIDFLNGDPRDYDRATVNLMVDELQGRLREACSYSIDQPARLKAFFNVQPARARILAALSSGRTMTRDALAAVAARGRIDELYSENATGSNIPSVHISALRKSLRPHGLEILTEWGVGYKCPPATCQRLKEIMKGTDA